MAAKLPIVAQHRSPSGLPSVQQILDRYVKAIGGKKNFMKSTALVQRGSFELVSPEAKGDFEMYSKAPNKVLTVINLNGMWVFKDGFNGVEGWSETPDNEVRQKLGLELADVKRQAEFYWCVKLSELFPTMTLKGTVKVGERDAYLIEAMPANGNPEKMYFDLETSLLIRKDSVAERPQGRLLVEGYLENYREVDGINRPFTIRLSSPSFNAVFQYKESKINIPIEDVMFDPPR
jgi:hypothetical protein